MCFFQKKKKPFRFVCVCCCFFFGKAKRRTSLKAVSAIECVCWMGYFFGKWLVYNIDFMLSHSCIHLYMHFQCVSPLHSLFLLSHCLFFTFCRFCLSFSRPLSFAWRLSYSKYELWTHFFGCFFFGWILSISFDVAASLIQMEYPHRKRENEMKTTNGTTNKRTEVGGR